MGLLDRTIKTVSAVTNVTAHHINAISTEINDSITSRDSASDMKECPACGQIIKGDNNFCPFCGAILPDMTISQGALCNSCGKQNTHGMRFCVNCGTKLPAAAAKDHALAISDATVLALWTEQLSEYPVWNGGGHYFSLREQGDSVVFSFQMRTIHAASAAIRDYRVLLKLNGFQEAGKHPTIEHLYKKIDQTCYHVDTEHCFEGDNNPSIYFNNQEPIGGYDYTKPSTPQIPFFKDILGGRFPFKKP